MNATIERPPQRQTFAPRMPVAKKRTDAKPADQKKPANPQLSFRVSDEVRSVIEESAKLLGMDVYDFLRMYLANRVDDMRQAAKQMAAGLQK